LAIISFDRDAVVDYVPEYSNNRDSDCPCIVRLKFVPFSRVQHYARILAARTNGMADMAKSAEITQEVQKKQFVENVESVTAYFVGDLQVTEPEVFYETADTDLVIEVIKAMESHSKLTEGQRKN
jgi:hypothetical protein